MNKRLPRPLVFVLATATALCLAVPVQAQGANSARAADFIVAVVNSDPITNSEVAAMRLRLLEDLSSRAAPLPDAAALGRQALEALINERAQLHLAQELGVRVDDEQLEQTEANIAARNQLTREALVQRLAQEGTSLASYRLQLRQQITLARLREREVESRLRVSEQDIDAFLDRQNSARTTRSELNLAMILVAVPENASETQLRQAQAKAQDIAQRARAGEDFGSLARAYSDASDRGVSGGVMGLRDATRYPDLFVEAVRPLAPLQVSDPVRSGAGFHVLKLLERQQVSVVKVVQTRARHILLRPHAQLTRDQALAELQQVRSAILRGQTSFAGAAQKISEDGSAAQGGDLGWSNPGQFVPEFEEVMSRLSPGQISEPVVSRFGVHLIEVTERREASLPEREQREAARAALREQRTQEAYERWVEEVRGRAYIEMREPLQLPALPVAGSAR